MKKTWTKENLLPARARLLQDKTSINSIKLKAKQDFTTNIKKLSKLKNFSYEFWEERLNRIR